MLQAAARLPTEPVLEPQRETDHIRKAVSEPIPLAASRHSIKSHRDPAWKATKQRRKRDAWREWWQWFKHRLQTVNEESEGVYDGTAVIIFLMLRRVEHRSHAEAIGIHRDCIVSSEEVRGYNYT
jgi:hypothetical protein